VKIAILNDTHFGIRNDNKVFVNHQARFFAEVFFPTVERDGIKTVCHLGDVFDRRKHVNFQTLASAKQFFFEPLKNRGITMHTIAGNHDVYYTTTNDVNSLDQLLGHYDNIKLYQRDPVHLIFDGLNVLMCPWLTRDNSERAIETISKSTASILMGHFDLVGFEMMKGVVSSHGLDSKTLSHFESVYTGHYHHASRQANVHYLGAQYQMTWSDYGYRRGFHILDTDTRELSFVENPNTIFHKIEYDDEDLTIEQVEQIDLSPLKDCYVKVVVARRNNLYLFDLFIDRLNNSGAADVKTVESARDHGGDDDEPERGHALDGLQDTQLVMHSYIDKLATNVDKGRIKSTVDALYLSALST
jgi:DNA repair exonuclease SbcCD nuclease subunit